MPLWESLDFQVYFTITASNVGYGFWSHDLGGHLTPSPPELYTRWVQWGAFSPIFRTHCTKDADNYRRIWLYPFYYYSIMRRYLQLRAALVPYTYTAAKEATFTGVSILRPMYYSSPEEEEAYTFDHQYMFGDQLVVAPVTQPLNPKYNTTQKVIWLPAGKFVLWHSGEMFNGPKTLSRNFTLEEMPVFATAGAVIPMRVDADLVTGSAQVLPSTLRLVVFVAGGYITDGRGLLYEDDGYTTKHEGIEFVETKIEYKRLSAEVVQLYINNGVGEFSGQLSSRKYSIEFRSVWPATRVQLDGQDLKSTLFDTPCAEAVGCWSYDGDSLSIVVQITTPLNTSAGHLVTAHLAGELPSALLVSNFSGRVARLRKAKQLLDNQWGTSDTVHQQDYPSVLLAGEAGMRLTYNPTGEQATAELKAFADTIDKARQEVAALKINDNLRSVVLELLS